MTVARSRQDAGQHRIFGHAQAMQIWLIVHVVALVSLCVRGLHTWQFPHQDACFMLGRYLLTQQCHDFLGRLPCFAGAGLISDLADGQFCVTVFSWVQAS